jgi:hypothetical protein
MGEIFSGVTKNNIQTYIHCQANILRQVNKIIVVSVAIKILIWYVSKMTRRYLPKKQVSSQNNFP